MKRGAQKLPIFGTTWRLKREYLRNETSYRQTENIKLYILEKMMNFSPQTADITLLIVRRAQLPRVARCPLIIINIIIIIIIIINVIVIKMYSLE